MTVALVIAFSGSQVSAADVEDHPARLTTAADSCLPAQRAIRFYRAKTNEIRSQFSTEFPDRIKWPTCYLARRAAREWRARARSAVDRYEHLYNWRAWLPANWLGVATCETGVNFEHANRRFLSAFGISVREYDADAAYFGAPPWSVRHTPRDQYDAARGHYARFGDGWSCPGP